MPRRDIFDRELLAVTATIRWWAVGELLLRCPVGTVGRSDESTDPAMTGE
jgi:hypothetical protein